MKEGMLDLISQKSAFNRSIIAKQPSRYSTKNQSGAKPGKADSMLRGSIGLGDIGDVVSSSNS
jgi:hypothetical protein